MSEYISKEGALAVLTVALLHTICKTIAFTVVAISTIWPSKVAQKNVWIHK